MDLGIAGRVALVTAASSGLASLSSPPEPVPTGHALAKGFAAAFVAQRSQTAQRVFATMSGAENKEVIL